MMKFNDLRIGLKLTLISNIVFIIVMVGIGVVVTKTQRTQIVEELIHTIERHNQGIVDIITVNNDVVVGEVKYDLNRLKFFFKDIFEHVNDSTGSHFLYRGVDFEKDKEKTIKLFQKEFNQGVKHVAIYRPINGKFICVNSTTEGYEGKIREYKAPEERNRLDKGGVFVYREKIGKDYLEVGCRSVKINGEFVGLIEVGRNEFSVNKVGKSFKRSNLLETGFTLLVEPNGKSKIWSKNADTRDIWESEYFQQIVNSDSVTGVINTYHNDTAVTVFFSKFKMRAANEITHYLVSIVKEQEYLKPVNATRNIIIIAIVIGCFIFIMYSFFIAKNISSGIYKIIDIIKEISKGKIDVELEFNRKDEIGIMSQSVGKLLAGLEKTEGFAREIGEGKFDAKYELLSDQDSLGLSLIKMRENLTIAKDKENERIDVDKKERWSSDGLAKFGEILRNNNTNMKALAYEFISNLVTYLNMNQGALFISNSAEDYDDITFEAMAAIAYDRSKIIDSKIKMGQGLVGRCAFEQKTIYITDVPDDYVNIASGLGTANPSVIILVPLVVDEKVVGVIELASFNNLEPYKITFIEKIAESIASSIISIKSTEETKKMLNESQRQKEEMASQEEELRQNLEEMQATQEDLKRHMEKNEEFRKELSQQNTLLDAIMNTLPDFIFFKDLQSKFIRVSNSMLGIFNAGSVDEVKGKSDFDYNPNELAQKYYDEEQLIIQSKQGYTNRIQKEVKTDGTEVEISLTKLPLIDGDGNVIGTFGISKDLSRDE